MLRSFLSDLVSKILHHIKLCIPRNLRTRAFSYIFFHQYLKEFPILSPPEIKINVAALKDPLYPFLFIATSTEGRYVVLKYLSSTSSLKMNPQFKNLLACRFIRHLLNILIPKKCIVGFIVERAI